MSVTQWFEPSKSEPYLFRDVTYRNVNDKEVTTNVCFYNYDIEGRGYCETENINYAIDYFQSKGFNDDQVAGILGNIAQESTFNPGAKNGSYYGLCQWDGDRQKDLKSFAATFDPKRDIGSLDTQLDFIYHEMQETKIEVAGNEYSYLDYYMRLESVHECSESFRKDFEKGANGNERLSFAQGIYDVMEEHYMKEFQQAVSVQDPEEVNEFGQGHPVSFSAGVAAVLDFDIDLKSEAESCTEVADTDVDFSI